MKKIFWMIPPTLILILAACGSSPANTATPIPTKISASQPSAISSDSVVASAKAQPAHHSQMSFVISAPVKEILVKKGEGVTAGQPLIVLSTLDLELSVKEAEWAVSSAQALSDRAHDPYKRYLSNGKILYAAGYVEKRNEMDAKLQAAQYELDIAKYTLAQGTLLAPFDGTIIDINIETGETAQTGKVVITEGDTAANMQIVTTDLSERDVPRVQVGQSVKIYIEALNANVSGKVIRIAPKSETVGGDVVYPVTIELDQPVEGLLWGMSAEVEIQTK